MKVTMEFNLPDETAEYKYAEHGVDYYLTLFDLYSHLRCKLKYEEDSLTDEKYAAYEEIQTFLFEKLNEHAVTIDGF